MLNEEGSSKPATLVGKASCLVTMVHNTGPQGSRFNLSQWLFFRNFPHHTDVVAYESVNFVRIFANCSRAMHMTGLK